MAIRVDADLRREIAQIQEQIGGEARAFDPALTDVRASELFRRVGELYRERAAQAFGSGRLLRYLHYTIEARRHEVFARRIAGEESTLGVKALRD